jgi:hypothetical protein
VVRAFRLPLQEVLNKPSADMIGHLIDQKSAKEFQHELKEWILGHGQRMMALTGQAEKAGIFGRRPDPNSVQIFPPCRFAWISYADDL